MPAPDLPDPIYADGLCIACGTTVAVGLWRLGRMHLELCPPCGAHHRLTPVPVPEEEDE